MDGPVDIQAWMKLSLEGKGSVHKISQKTWRKSLENLDERRRPEKVVHKETLKGSEGRQFGNPSGFFFFFPLIKLFVNMIYIYTKCLTQQLATKIH